MGTTALSSLLPLLQLPRCPGNVMLQALRRTCRQFCLLTEVWREELAGIAAVEDQEGYTLDPGYDDVTILRVFQVELDDAVLAESAWSVSQGSVLTLDPAPVADGALAVSVVYVPHPDCAEVVDWLVERWGDAIAAGAAGDLKSDPQSASDAVPWYDPTGAGLMRERYRDGVADAKASLLVGLRSGEVHVLHSPFYL